MKINPIKLSTAIYIKSLKTLIGIEQFRLQLIYWQILILLIYYFSIIFLLFHERLKLPCIDFFFIAVIGTFLLFQFNKYFDH